VSYAPYVPLYFTDFKASATTLLPRGWKFTTKSDEHPCNDDQKRLIETEISYARQLVEHTINDLHLNGYYDTFFAWTLREDAYFESKVLNVYRKVARMLDIANSEYEMKLTCDHGHDFCNRYVAHILDGEKRVNFCKTFFTGKETGNSKLTPTDDKLAKCRTLNLRDMQHTLSAVLIHECTHTGFAMDSTEGYASTHDTRVGSQVHN
jgi:hypothetical protein